MNEEAKPPFSPELPDDLRVALHEMQADLDYVFARGRIEPQDVADMFKESFRTKLSHIEEAAYRLNAQAARIAALETENARLREALEWYGEQARLCRLITSEGDPGRRALDADGGKRARAALQGEK